MIVASAAALPSTAAPHAALPVQSTVQLPVPHVTGPLHASWPVQCALNVVAVLPSTAAPHASPCEQYTSQVPVPHVVTPVHDCCPPQLTTTSVAPFPLMWSPHEPSPVHCTLQGTPGAQVMGPGQAF